MSLFDGLTLNELVLLLSGGVLFVALLVVFLGKALANRPVAVLLPFFAIAIVMMGFPTISAVKIGQEGVDIENQTTALQNNPDDEAARKKLEADVSDLKSRSFKNPETIAKIARAEFALGHNADAKQDMEKANALQADPKSQTTAAKASQYDTKAQSALQKPSKNPASGTHRAGSKKQK